MNKYKLIVAALVMTTVAAGAGYYSYQSSREKELAMEQELLLNENVEALTFFEAFMEWWDRLDYVCEDIRCYDFAVGWYVSTMYSKVEAGTGTNAHWYDCTKGCYINSLRDPYNSNSWY